MWTVKKSFLPCDLTARVVGKLRNIVAWVVSAMMQFSAAPLLAIMYVLALITYW